MYGVVVQSARNVCIFSSSYLYHRYQNVCSVCVATPMQLLILCTKNRSSLKAWQLVLCQVLAHLCN